MKHEDEIVTDEERALFDKLLDAVVASLPKSLVDKLEEIPLIVEDYPSDEIIEEMEIDDPGSLCGLHTGIPLTERSVEHSGTIPDTINIYRDGILNQSMNGDGVVDEGELTRQIRITVLHEMGHHFGLDEDDLKELGYG